MASGQIVPRYAHDCHICTFLGVHENYDLYYCPQGGERPTIIARFGDDGPEYTSGMTFALNGSSEPLVIALRLAVEMGLVSAPRRST